MPIVNNESAAGPAGLVFDTKRFAVHDGPGIRTTVFLKGCALKCPWCHNPEGRAFGPEIFFMPARCIGCGRCIEACPNGCHRLLDGRHVFVRDDCTACGRCAAVCYAEALELVGRRMTVDEVMAEVVRDQPFYETSGGGMTISGGEPMMQFEFSRALLCRARGKGLHTCLDTSGTGEVGQYVELLPLVDLFLWDYKETDPAKHREATGAEREPILANLRKVDRAGVAVILRCPIIPGINDRPDHFAGIAEVADGTRNLVEVHIEPYHPLGRSKHGRLGRSEPLPAVPSPGEEQIARWVETVAGQCKKPVKRA